MDNNLINIDDLVRQRLGGGEEQERAGAWLRMQDLLEQDKRRKPLGMFNWKRAMTLGGLLLLLGTATVGTYEVTTAFRGNGNNTASENTGAVTGKEISGSATAAAKDNNGATASENAVSNPSAEHITNNKSVAAATGRAKSATVASNSHVNNHTDNHTTNHTENSYTTTSSVPASAATANTTNGNVNNNGVHTLTKHNGQTAGTKEVAIASAVNTPAKGTQTNRASDVAAVNKISNSAAGPRPAMASGSSMQSPDVQPDIDLSAATASADNSQKNTTTSTGTRDNISVDKIALSAAATSGKSGVKQADNIGLVEPTAKNNNAAADKSAVVGNNNNSNVNTTAASATVLKKAADLKATARKQSKSKMSMAITPRKNTVVVNHTNTGYTKGTPSAAVAMVDAGSGSKSPAATKGGMKMTEEEDSNFKIYGSKSHNAVAAKKSVPNLLPAKTADKTAAQASPAEKEAAEKGSEVAEKKIVKNVKVHQTRKGTFPGRTEVQLDTTGIEDEEVTIAAKKIEDAAPVAAQPENNYGSGAASTAAKKSNAPDLTKSATKTAQAKTSAAPAGGAKSTAATSSAAVTSGSNNSVAASTVATAPVTSAASAAAAPVVPAATATTAEIKPAAVVKKKSKSHFFENLSAAFNDIKYKLSGAQFAPGLTAGINGTFFGPNSFKGFQFGGTANFEIDEKWSFMAELKYFHRMNNNFAMYDTYIDYKNNDSITNTFSFSTLHSFELPFSIRHSFYKFDFFAGGNLVYTLSVNTGPAPLTYAGGSIPYAPGYATAPQLSESDFSSRFGVGYLFGMAYKAAPNVTLDFRTVQTVWDNMKTSGAERVSNQLYKSPSLQFSLIYRLGAKKDKD